MSAPGLTSGSSYATGGTSSNPFTSYLTSQPGAAVSQQQPPMTLPGQSLTPPGGSPQGLFDQYQSAIYGQPAAAYTPNFGQDSMTPQSAIYGQPAAAYTPNFGQPDQQTLSATQDLFNPSAGELRPTHHLVPGPDQTNMFQVQSGVASSSGGYDPGYQTFLQQNPNWVLQNSPSGYLSPQQAYGAYLRTITPPSQQQQPAPTPAPKPAPQPTPVAKPVVRAPAPVAKPVVKPAPQPTPAPKPVVRAPAPVAKPVAKPAPAPVAKPVAKPAPQPLRAPARNISTQPILRSGIIPRGTVR